MSSNNPTDDTWTGYIGNKVTNGLALTFDAVQNTASATIEYGREKLTTPELSEKLAEKMCFDFNAAETFDGINNRLEQSKMASNPRIQAEIQHVAAGRHGEDLVQQELKKLGHVRSAVRIPGCNGKRSEIDLVLQTRSHIYLFEVKYWSGSVELTPDGQWKQIRNKNANPPEIIHENVLEKIRDKELLFREKLNLPKTSVSSFIVFPKSNLTLTYAIGREPQVLSSVEFQTWVESEMPSAIKSVVDLVLPKSWTGFNDATSNNIDGTLGTCGTWDLVYLEGGRTLQGDFRSGPRELGQINRSEVGSAKFSHVRNAVIGGTLAVFGRQPKTTVYLYRRNTDLFSSMFSMSFLQFELAIDSVIIFREAGQRSDTRVEVNDIRQIDFSQK